MPLKLSQIYLPMTYLRLKFWGGANLITCKNRLLALPFAKSIDRELHTLKIYQEKVGLIKKNLFDYIKLRNNLNVNTDLVTANKFNVETAIKQTFHFILYSTEPSPREVIRLFALYSSLPSNTSLLKHFSHKSNKKFLESRVISSISYMTPSELHQFASLLTTFTAKTPFIKLLKKTILQEISLRLGEVDSLTDAFRYFATHLELEERDLNYYGVYNKFFAACEKYLDSANPIHLSHILYFLGLGDKLNLNTQLALVASQRLHPHFKDIPFTDVGLALMGLFRASLNLERDVPLANAAAVKLMEHISKEGQNVRLSTLDSSSLISVVKYLRLTSYYNQDLLDALKLFLHKLHQDSFTPPFMCHILALYANCNVYDQKVYSLLEKEFLRFLEAPDENLRIKDISRMTWALAHTQHSCTESFLKLVVQSLNKLCETSELVTFHSHVIDATLSLAMFNVFPEKLYSSILRPNIMDLVRGKARIRYLSRFLILSQIQGIVWPSLSLPLVDIPPEEIPKRTIEDECIHRPSIKRISKALEWLRRNCGQPIFELDFLVPNINHCSIVLKAPIEQDAYLPSEIGQRAWENLKPLEGRRIAIDMNDSNTCLTGEGTPVGMEVLKRNLLRRQGWTVKILSSSDLNRCRNDMDLAATLLQTVIEDPVK